MTSSRHNRAESPYTYTNTEEQRPVWVGVGREAAVALEAGEVVTAAQPAQASALAAQAAPAAQPAVQAPIGGVARLTHARRQMATMALTPRLPRLTPRLLRLLPRLLRMLPPMLAMLAMLISVPWPRSTPSWVTPTTSKPWAATPSGSGSDNNLIEMNGGYWQNTMLPGGQQAMVRVQPPRQVLEADADNEAETAQLVYRNLDAAQLAILKKVLFNPEAFTYFSWAKSKGHLGEDKDFGDFVNQCIKLTMTKIFGARVGVVVEWGSYFGCSLCRGAIRYQEGECS